MVLPPAGITDKMKTATATTPALLLAALLIASPAVASTTSNDDGTFYIVRKPLPQSDVSAARQLATSPYPELSFEEAIAAIKEATAATGSQDGAAKTTTALAVRSEEDAQVEGITQRLNGGGNQWGCVQRGLYSYCGGQSGWSAGSRLDMPGWVVSAGAVGSAILVWLA
ncbi:hypothetical protein MCOR29_008884 [Pyricularia oryzae]|nr:hypothetical protein MCOR01_005414 [Pyricularia oryzae]KAI6253820.1 hypothetical protein MCOR19_009637 [Pyricularia oryzae]KAI6271364.1 hypothetical protein MCOR26_007844 [Pyricularia oryzae]KAI6309605.1 hypothetical protein MCOR29_008884 [Pyricularia oryzae]KAI6336198.1 hypothetical protein MCOR28_009304 [Pyricularia oryzae]